MLRASGLNKAQFRSPSGLRPLAASGPAPQPGIGVMAVARWGWAGLVLALVIAGAGCGGGPGPPDATSAPSVPSSSAVASVTSTASATPTPSLVVFPAGYAEPQDLGVLPGARTSAALDVNNRGVVVGVAYLPVGGEVSPVAVWWPTPRSAPLRLDQELGIAVTAGSSAERVNDRGQVLVTSGGRAWVVDPVARLSRQVRVTFPGTSEVSALDMNGAGDVVGSATVGSVQESEGEHALLRAFLWRHSTGRAVDLGLLPGEESSQACGINDDDQVVGMSGERAFVWDPESEAMRALDPRPAQACSITDNGLVAGTVAGGRAVVWDLRARTVDSLGPAARFGGVAINEAGWVVGSTSLGSSWLWNPVSRTTIEVVPRGTGEAHALNDLGHIVGIADAHAALWSPLPG